METDSVNVIALLTVILPAITALGGTVIANISMGKKHTLDLMRLQILSTELPANIRLQVYDEYKKKGGNSWLDGYVTTVLKPMAIGQLTGKGRRKEDHA